jgi:hypothetical protein
MVQVRDPVALPLTVAVQLVVWGPKVIGFGEQETPTVGVAGTTTKVTMIDIVL